MTTTTGTTKEPRIKTASRRRKVAHYFRVEHMRACADLGVDMRSLCGVWSPPSSKKYAHNNPDVIQTVANVMPLPETSDCLRCQRALESALRRELKRQEAGQ